MNNSWPITYTDSALCAVEDRVILQSLWNITLAPPWQFRLYGLWANITCLLTNLAFQTCVWFSGWGMWVVKSGSGESYWTNWPLPVIHTRQLLTSTVKSLNVYHYWSWSVDIWVIIASSTCTFWSAWRPCGTLHQNDKISSKKFCCLWSNTVELIAVNSSWSITHTDSVLCTLDHCVILQSLWNIRLAPLWQFTL